MIGIVALKLEEGNRESLIKLVLVTFIFCLFPREELTLFVWALGKFNVYCYDVGP